MRLVAEAAWEEVLAVAQRGAGKPITDCCSGLFGNFKLDRSAGFLLDHGSAVPHLASAAYIVDPEPHEIAAPQLAIDGEIEQGEVASPPLKLEPDADGPDLLGLQRALLADEAPFVPRC